MCPDIGILLYYVYKVKKGNIEQEMNYRQEILRVSQTWKPKNKFGELIKMVSKTISPSSKSQALM